MASEGAPSKHDVQALLPLVQHNALLFEENGKVRVPHKLPTPVDEHGIPLAAAMVRKLLKTMDTPGYVWTGKIDEHHMATPGQAYRDLNGEDGLIGSQYRGAPMLKVKLPRQMHNLAHNIFEVPRMPKLDVVRQLGMECDQLMRLKDTLSYKNGIEYDIDEERKEELRLWCFRTKLKSMVDGELGIMPDKDWLAELSLEDARRTVFSLTRVRRLPHPKLIHPKVRQVA